MTIVLHLFNDNTSNYSAPQHPADGSKKHLRQPVNISPEGKKTAVNMLKLKFVLIVGTMERFSLEHRRDICISFRFEVYA